MAAVALLGAAATAAFAQRDFGQVEIKTEKRATHVWAVQRAGGNIALCAGPDGAPLERYRDMLKDTRAAVAKLAKEKKTLARVQAAKPTAPWDADFGIGFVRPELDVEMLDSDLAR